ncbi:hypothetical protein N7517_004720 [Penicillium concentricum]|uniref:Uncharacterized protein n=1 Tax=Penicillium concentricum TaxID=293559 RepID=A0A9W9V9M9_9EURO|nr:uncharacterized protein N7517_004720 [Penicillium concentricum]KAJ5372714.1 hypothetical protein N7517_004720 [Penicillium concentricum]
MATAPVGVQYGFSSENQEWVPPPRRVKLSDEGVYMAFKTMTAVERADTFPGDFDRHGHVRATRNPEDPTPSFRPAHLTSL